MSYKPKVKIESLTPEEHYRVVVSLVGKIHEYKQMKEKGSAELQALHQVESAYDKLTGHGGTRAVKCLVQMK